MKYILYTEDPPVKNGIVSTGLSRVNSHIARAIGNDLLWVLIGDVSIRRSFDLKNVDDFISDKSTLIIKKGFSMVGLFVYLSKIFRLHLPIPQFSVSVKSISEISEADAVLAPIGTDVNALYRAHFVAKKLGLPLYIYLVDEPISAASLISKPLSTKAISKLGRYIASSEKIFCITEGLAELVENQFSVPAIPLALPFETDIRSHMAAQRNPTTVVFIGNTSHFYQQGIVDCIIALDELRDEGTQLKFVFTIENDFTKRLLEQHGNEVISIRACPNNIDLANLLSEALVAFVSYSFEEKYVDMVKTSFPSKLMEYFAYADRIFLYAPEYSAAATVVKKYDLKLFLSERSINKLKNILLEISTSKINYRNEYLSYLNLNHNYCNFLSKISA
jgi:hypothetical protein